MAPRRRGRGRAGGDERIAAAGMQQIGLLRAAAALARMNQRNGYRLRKPARGRSPADARRVLRGSSKAVAKRPQAYRHCRFFARHSVAGLSGPNIGCPSKAGSLPDGLAPR